MMHYDNFLNYKNFSVLSKVEKHAKFYIKK